MTGEARRFSSCIRAMTIIGARLEKHLWDAYKGARLARFSKRQRAHFRPSTTQSQLCVRSDPNSALADNSLPGESRRGHETSAGGVLPSSGSERDELTGFGSEFQVRIWGMSVRANGARRRSFGARLRAGPRPRRVSRSNRPRRVPGRVRESRVACWR